MGDFEAGEEVARYSPACCWQCSTSSGSRAYAMCLWESTWQGVCAHV